MKACIVGEFKRASGRGGAAVDIGEKGFLSYDDYLTY